jgi:hypothetical protein
MSEQINPSKPIQISAYGWAFEDSDGWVNKFSGCYALCEDGSIWHWRGSCLGWQPVELIFQRSWPTVPTEAKND